MSEQQEAPLRPVGTKNMADAQGGKNQDMCEMGFGVKELALCIDRHHQLPEQPLVKCIVSITSLGAVSGLNASEWKSRFLAAAGSSTPSWTIVEGCT